MFVLIMALERQASMDDNEDVLVNLALELR